jgi:large subunit ribosomal protein L24
MKTHVKTGDEVVVIAGNARGKYGKILQVFPKKNQVLLEALTEDKEGKRWINVMKKHEKKTQDNPDGSIVEREAPIHISNVMKAERYKAKRKK